MLPPLPVALPMLIAAVLLTLAHVWPRRVPDTIAALTALAVTSIGLLLLLRAAGGPITYWFGQWEPRDGVVLGISFQVDQVGAAMVTLIGILFTGSFVFAWGFFDEVHAVFHVLMLMFMAALSGFCLTHDLFNMFVWFEVMSVAAFALTAYRLEASALEAGLNFTVTNSLASFFMLAGIALIYSIGGTLDFSALAGVVGRSGGNPVILASFCLLLAGLLIKAAMVPFQLWLADAHALAPSPVCVIFSGAMVTLGLYGASKLAWQVFGSDPVIRAGAQHVMLAMGVASTIVGGVMCVTQRHVKRLLAFSTISHTGIMLIGCSIFTAQGQAGTVLYMLGHGLVKGALFMTAGILLATCGGIDEIGLRGLGRQIRPAGIAMAGGGLLLAGAPVGLMQHGTTLIETAAAAAGRGWVAGVMILGGALTGGAVLRVTGRIFLGLGALPGEEDRSPTEAEQEASDRPLWLMLTPCASLLALSLAAPSSVETFALRAITPFIGAPAASLQSPPAASSHDYLPWLTVMLALLIAAYDLSRQHLPGMLIAAADASFRPLHALLEAWHSGLVGDYVAWIVFGLALVAGCITWLAIV
ncbi:MAG TPA: proton-conducting transporter membrane subunit [Rhodopila sp.]